MGRRKKSALRILACSLCLAVLAGCSVTLGPMTEKKLVVVRPGVPVEILENRELDCRILTDEDGVSDIFHQDVGGWIAMPPEHWETLKAEFERLKEGRDDDAP